MSSFLFLKTEMLAFPVEVEGENSFWKKFPATGQLCAGAGLGLDSELSVLERHFLCGNLDVNTAPLNTVFVMDCDCSFA